MQNNSTTNYPLFIGGYSSAAQPAVHGFLFDPAGPLLIPQHAYSGIANPSFLTAHSNGEWLYAVSEIGMHSHGQHGEVWAFSITRDSLRLQLRNQHSSAGDAPCHLTLDRSGRRLVVSNYGSGNATLYPLRSSGALDAPDQVVQHTGSGEDRGRQAGPHAHSALFTPDNRFLIVADLGIDQLVVYAFDAAVGRLRRHATVATAPGAGPRHMAFHPHGRFLYVLNELDCTLTTYAYTTETGAFTLRNTLLTLPAGAPDSLAADIHVAPDGRYLYVSNRGHDTIAVFSVAADGDLQMRGHFPCGGAWPRNFAISPDGRFLLIANQHSDEIVVLSLLADGATLGNVVHRQPLAAPTCITFL